MMNKPLLPVLPILLILLAGVAAAAPWADAVPAGHWMSPFDSFEENISLSLARERVEVSSNATERQGALRDWRDLLDALSAERAAEKAAIEARYASGGVAPAAFNRAVDQIRAGERRLEESRGALVLSEGRALAFQPPPPPSDLANTTFEPYRLNWSWREPPVALLRVEASLDGAPPSLMPPGVGHVELKNAIPDRDYTLSLRVVDARGLVSPWANHTARTAPDPPPGNVTNLSVTGRGQTWVSWNWSLPADGDLSHVQFLVNGAERTLLTLPGFNLTNLSPGATVTVSVRAVDRAGQRGPWTNATGKTLPAPTPTPALGGWLFTPPPGTPAPASCPRCEDVDCDSCDNGICYKWKVTQGEGQGEGKQKFTCALPSPSPSPG